MNATPRSLSLPMAFACEDRGNPAHRPRAAKLFFAEQSSTQGKHLFGKAGHSHIVFVPSPIVGPLKWELFEAGTL